MSWHNSVKQQISPVSNFPGNRCRYRPGEMEPITVEADDNLFSYIKTTVKNKVLKIYIPDSVNIVKYASMNVLISMPTLGSLKASNHSR